MQVRRILDTKGSFVATVVPSTTLGEAARVLAEHRIGALVVSADGTSIVGMFSERDLARAVASSGADVLRSRVESVMSTDVRTCAPSDTVDWLMAEMTTQRIRHLPVVDGGEVVGLVSIGDVVKYRVEELQTESRTLHDYLYSGR